MRRNPQDTWTGSMDDSTNQRLDKIIFLLGLAFRNEIEQARRGLAQKSFKLFSREWTEKGHVHENYNATTGNGDDVNNSDKFYHWGALLGYMEYLEQSRTQK